ncbi:hypothetical protein SXCC_03561 [Gluconacetobacter sp. SXCC-1]|nr:hypothetical protein SXCC_03561 [Gluconacetobacter sp. SXCC-1]
MRHHALDFPRKAALPGKATGNAAFPKKDGALNPLLFISMFILFGP